MLSTCNKKKSAGSSGSSSGEFEGTQRRGCKEEEGSIEIPYERVQAVGDILLISPEIVEAPATPQL